MEYNDRRKKHFTKVQADEAGINYKFWMDPTVVDGDYIITDNDIVLYVKRVKAYVNVLGARSTFVQTAFGVYVLEQSKTFRVDGRKGNCRLIYSGKIGKQDELTKSDKQFIDYIFDGLDIKQAANLAYNGKRIFTNRILKKEMVVKYMSEKYQKEMESAGITKEWYFSRLKAEAETVGPNVKMTERFQVLERVGQLLDIVPISTKTTESENVKGLYIDEATVKAIESHHTRELTK